MIDKMIMSNCKIIITNLSVAWIDYKKTYAMVPYTWFLEFLKICEITDNIRNVIEKSVKNWKVELTAGAETIGEVKIDRGIFEDVCYNFDTFVLLLRDVKARYISGTFKGRINHLLFMDDLNSMALCKNLTFLWKQ